MQRLYSHLGTSTTSLSERSLLLRGAGSLREAQLRKICTARKCLHSKAALLTLLWSFIVYLVYMALFSAPSIFYYNCNHLIFYLSSAVLYFTFPLAGHLADTKFGRFKTIIGSLWLLLIGLLLFFFGLPFVFLFVDMPQKSIHYTMRTIGLSIFAISIVPLVLGITGFIANKFQFGLDQLYEFPGEDQSLFIHWSTWTYYAALLLWKTSTNPFIKSHPPLTEIKQVLAGTFLIIVIMVLLISLCLSHFNRLWFLAEPSRANPYKLVLQVTKYSYHHKVPANRSAFTYCEDEIPSGLDLGKGKYGGPFTIEQVEDVKAFYGIFRVILAVSLVFFVDIAKESLQPLYHSSIHGGVKCLNNVPFTPNINTSATMTPVVRLLVVNGMVFPLTAFLSLPLYLLVLRPYIINYIPGMLKRMGLGIALTVAALACTLATEVAIHVKNKELSCMFKPEESSSLDPSVDAIVVQMLIARGVLSGISRMLTYIPLYEFICSQSPKSMNGLLIGLSYSTRGFFEALGSSVVVPFALSWNGPRIPSCGMVYYFINIAIAFAGGIALAYAAKKYSYRKRDEICHVYRYAEEYYSK